MPDISMCNSGTCLLRKQCIRHAESGTKPSDYQYYSDFAEPEQTGGCEYFINNERKVLY